MSSDIPVPNSTTQSHGLPVVLISATTGLPYNSSIVGGSGGTSSTDKAVFTEGADAFTPIGGVFNDTITADPTEDHAATARITAKRAIHVNLRDASGNEVSVGGGTQYTEDVAAAADPIGTMQIAVRADSPAAITSTDGDNIAVRATNKGEQYVKHLDSIAVTGTFWQATQPISGTVTANLGTITGVSTLAEQQTQTTSLQLLDNVVVTTASAISSQGYAISGTDGTNARIIKTDTAGELQIDVLTMPTTTITGTVSISGTVPVSATNLDIRDLAAATDSVTIGDGTNTATIRNLASNDALNVAIVDGAGAHITSFGGGTQYTEGDTDASITGTAVMWEDATDTLRAVSAAKPLPVNVVAGGAGDGAILDGVSSSIKATVLDYTNSNPIAVRLTDTAGDYIAAGAGTQYTEDIASAADPIGTMGIAVRADSLAAVTTTDGDNIAFRATNKGELYVKHVDGIPVTNTGTFAVQAAQSGTWNITNISGTVSLPTGASTLAEQQTQTTALQLIDDPVATLGTTTYTETTTKGFIIGAIRRDADTTLVDTTNEVSPLQVDANGRLKVEIFDGGDSHTVDGTVSAAQSGTWNITNVSGTVSLPTGASTLAEQQTQTTALQLIDDTVATTGSAIPTKGIAASGTDGTNARVLKTDASGELQVDVLTLPTATVAQSTAASLKGQMMILDSAGTNVASVNADGAVMTSPLPSGKTDLTKRFSVSVPTGAQTVTIDSDAATSRAVKEIYVGGNGFNSGAYFDFKRNAVTIGSTYMDAAPAITIDDLTYYTQTLTCDCNTMNAGTMTVYFTVKYYQ